MKRLLLLFPILISSAFAKPIPASLFTDHAILQRDQPVPVWGTADVGEKVTVEFSGKDFSATADAKGFWKIQIPPMPANSTPQVLAIRGATGDPIQLSDILVGEVWVASGQSNMEFLLNSSANATEEKASANYPLIRQFAVSHTGSLQAQDSVKGTWTVCSPSTAGSFTAVGYFFARNLFQKLGIPVGLIHSSYGGTPAESWTSREALNTLPELKSQAEEKIALMEQTPAAILAFPKDLAAWEVANGVDDKENEGFKNGWAAPDFDDSSWAAVTAGFNIGTALKSKTGGIFWMRKAVDLPPESEGKPFRLGLGYLAEQYDTVYFNGVQVGSIGKNPPAFYTAPRDYAIPANLVKAGRNVIAVRYVSHTEKGGFYIAASKMQLPVKDPRSLDSLWKISFERAYPPLTAEALAKRPKIHTQTIQNTPTGLFNAMINPLIPYAIRGVIWYQGESNASAAELYKKIFPLMIADWRSRWGQGNFPFYFVQLANNDTVNRSHADSSWPVLREAQCETLAHTPNTGMAVIIDVGSDLTIHPTNKQDVGNRLALWARAKTYGEKDMVYRSPLYSSHTLEGNKIRVHFDNGGAPLMVGKKSGLAPAEETPGQKLDWFEIAGADGKFVWADAVIAGESVVVSSAEVQHPVQVRYAWATNPAGCNLYNKAGLPASPFRTVSTAHKP